MNKKKQPAKLKKVWEYLLVSLIIFTLLSILSVICHYIKNGSFSIEFASKRFVKQKDKEQYCCSQPIDDNRGIAFINYDCTPINKITKGIQNCNGRYYLFLNKIDNKWVVNESSKRVIW